MSGRLVVGTAGHIDHGKTRLVLALTGIDCDRLAEEKARGITIDLGFAHLEENGTSVGFVDVPGHERFLHNALAGLGGIGAMLLVVAADEGIQPQTREHLAICALLGIPRGIVALTKSDLVEPELRDLVQLEIEELLATTPFAGAPIVAVSSTTGEGVGELKTLLLELAASTPESTGAERPARLPIDRAFHRKGEGTIVTGTLTGGAIRTGDGLELLPAGVPVRVRGVQVHGRAVEEAVQGQRTALQLAGVELEALGRGMTLGEPRAFVAGRTLLARFSLLGDAPSELRGVTPVRFHLYSSEVLGTLRPLEPAVLAPGAAGYVELRLSERVVAVRGDRFVVRRPSPPATLGGGEILDPAWRRRRGAALVPALAALGAGQREALLQWVRDAGERGSDANRLAPRLGRRPAEVETALRELAADSRLLLASGAAVSGGRSVPAGPVGPAGTGATRFILPNAYLRVADRARSVLEEFFRNNRLAPGMPKAEAVKRILPGPAAELETAYLGWLQAQGILAVDADLVNPPGRGDALSGEESKLATAVLRRFEAAGLEPPGPSELRETLGTKAQILDGVVRYLVERRRLTRLPGGLILATTAVDALRAALLATGWERFGVPTFKERFGLSRKWAIPLLEHLDSLGATRRLGDERQVVRPVQPV